MTKRFTFTVIALLICFNVYSQSTDQKIDELMNEYSANGQFNGTILVKKNRNIIYQKAFGLANREWNIPNTIDTKFLAGSIGKSFTAFMVMILVCEGKIDLNASINKYIPEYSGPGKNEVTVHQMLTHTSGIPNHGAIPNLSKKIVRWTYDTEQYLDLIKDVNLLFKPGTAFAYSGIAYNLLAIICEKVSKKEFGDLLKEKLFLPLGMNNTKLDKNLDIDENRANGYEYHLLEGYMNPSFIDMSHVKGSGGILTTAEDLSRFNSECFCTHKLLTENLYEKIFTRYIKDWQYYGYGWWITDKLINNDSLILISHGGSTDGYKAYNTRIVNDSIDIILFQNNYYRTELGVKFDYAITNELIDILYGKHVALPKKSIAKELGYYIGRYGIINTEEKYLTLKTDTLYFIDENEFNQMAKELYKNYNLKTESEKIFEIALKEFPESFILNYSYGVFLSEIGNSKAIEYLLKCKEIYLTAPNEKKYKPEYEKAVKIINENK